MGGFSKSIRLICLVIIVLATACSGGVVTTPSVEDYVAKGDEAFQAGHYEDAYAYYNKAIKQNVDLARAYGGRGAVMNVWRRYEEAAGDFTKSLAYVHTPEVLAGRCIAFRFLALLDKAKADCSEALKLNPDSVDAIIASANISMQEKRPSEAVTMLKDAIQKNNKSSLLVYSLGQVYLEQGNLDEAINYLSQAISLDPNQAQFYCDRGFLYYSTAKLDLTKKDLQKAIDKGIEGKDDECVFKAQSMLQVLNKKP